MSREKATKAATLLRKAGIESASAGVGEDTANVVISPEDAMKLLILTGKDLEKAFDHAERVKNRTMSEINDLTGRLNRLRQILNHKPEECAKGDHVIDSYVTGGRNGHTVSRCLVCDFKQEGWD